MYYHFVENYNNHNSAAWFYRIQARQTYLWGNISLNSKTSDIKRAFITVRTAINALVDNHDYTWLFIYCNEHGWFNSTLVPNL